MSRQSARYARRRQRQLRAFVAVAVVVGSLPLRSDAQAPNPAALHRIDDVFRDVATDSTPGCGLGLFRDGREGLTRYYGMADLSHGVPITANSVFEIGSVTKSFTAALISALAASGRIDLDDPIRKYLPELSPLYAPVTVRHLLYHTGGVRDWTTLWEMSGRAWSEDWPQPMLIDLLNRQTALSFTPGTGFLYSNSGYFLLGVIVSRASGKSLREFADSVIFRPLGMTSTQFLDDPARIVRNRAVAYMPGRSGYIVSTSTTLGTGEGGMLSTVGDMARWAESLGNASGASWPWASQLVEPYVIGTDTLPMRRGLLVDEAFGLPVRMHNGRIDAVTAIVQRFPTVRTSVVAFCNGPSGPSAQDRAMRVAAIYLEDQRLIPSGRDARPTAPAAVDRRLLGTYWDAQQDDYFEIIVRDSALAIRGGPPLISRGESRYAFCQMRYCPTVTFSGDSNISLHEGTRVVGTFRRVAAVKPTRQELERYVGTYRSAELDTWGTVSLAGDTLMLAMRYARPVRLTPMNAGGFRASIGRVRFERSGASASPVMYLSQNGASRIRFTRVD